MTQRPPDDDPSPEAPAAKDRAAPVPRTVVAPPVARTLLAGGSPSTAGDDPVIGQELCGYTVRRKLAEGGMGVVYEGLHRTLGRLGRHQGPEAGVLPVERRRRALPSRGARRQRHPARQHRRHRRLRARRPGARLLRHGVPRGRVAGGPHRARAHSLGRGVPDPRPDAACPAGRARPRASFTAISSPTTSGSKPSDGRVIVKLLDFGIAKLIGPANEGEIRRAADPDRAR